MMDQNRHNVVILSAGRTATVFLTHFLNRYCGEIFALHEPPPSRSILMAANFRNRTGIGTKYITRRYATARSRILAHAPAQKRYVEVNPMLCALTDVVADSVPRLHVIHLVRHPRTWASSIVNFGAKKWRRHLIDYVPFATPYPPQRPDGWASMPMEERALWRWRFCNERISQTRPLCEGYTLIRYEDMFSGDEDRRAQSMQALFDALETNTQLDCRWLSEIKPMNVSPPSSDKAPDLKPEMVESVCQPLLKQYGYGD